MSERNAIERLFPRVEKPGRYTGGEWNAVRKEPERAEARIALAFPDVYEIGMSYLGQKILYERLNERPEWAAERVFAPWPDMEEALRATGTPLFSLENRTPLRDFDIVGFSLLYELNYSNVLTILDLGGIPLEAAGRGETDPLVIAGGPAVFNPEPVAEFFDAFFAGDGEEAFAEIVEHWLASGRKGLRRAERLRSLADLKGVYIPALYEAGPVGASALHIVRPRPEGGGPYPIMKRLVSGFARSPFPADIVVPNVQSVFDRVAVEVARGCPQKCRFCQATSLYAPYRVKDPGAVTATAVRSVERTGYEDASLFSLSVGDYPYLSETVETLMTGLESRRASLSLSSLRPKGLSARIIREISRVRKTGFTLVAEAGTDRLRRVINKDVTDSDLMEAAANAFREGWRLLKIYVMIGLPTETLEDVEAIAGLAERLTFLGRETSGGAPQINLSVSSFIPKPHTPFQWAAMDPADVLLEKQRFLRDRLARRRNVKVKVHPIENSLLEGVFSRGDRRLGSVLLRAWKLGARFDSWGDKFRFDVWQQAFREEGVDPESYLAALDLEAVLPWDHMDTGMTREFFRRENDRALKAETTPSCLDESCGACRGCGWIKQVDKTFPPVPTGAGSNGAEERNDGRRGGELLRVEAVYIKEGPIRYIGHNDLINTIQRTFRRAGVAVAYSEGFHPKMRMSFLPPLALGMEGRDERLEFRAGGPLDIAAALASLNACSPEGLRFRSLDVKDQDSVSLSRRLRGLVYGVDLADPRIVAAVSRSSASGERTLTGDKAADFVRARIAASDFGPDGPVVEVAPSANRLLLKYSFNPQKAPRPQDAVSSLLGLADPAFVIV
ncbi:MAG: TIGR03960 family B12-binding radical SAM protein, partial [Candidatus Aminicenantes bacterium]|nr:TIGR03960 family B12-binding radical SAM protein [Candidatus Aminicenantes bacterium]